MLLDEDSGPLGTATQLSGEANDARPAPAKVQKYLTSLADAYGLPAEVIHAVAQTESGFDTGKVRTVAQPFRAGIQEGWREGTVVQKRKFTPFNLMP
ncbi:MAG: hypothetical protein DMG48_01935 [Acidobacteria bacterium]|nr:MAG: hypothetical protein DMG48_01935 [Acidobacteriota bacterium]